MGQIDAGTITQATIVNADIAAGAGIAASKVVHQQVATTDFNLASTATPTAQKVVVYIARGVATIRDFAGVLMDTGTTTDIDHDLLINGVSALSAQVNHTNADTDGVPKAGTISTSALASGDVVEIQQIITTSTGALGGAASVRIDSNHV